MLEKEAIVWEGSDCDRKMDECLVLVCLRKGRGQGNLILRAICVTSACHLRDGE